ncbi:MAG: SDR family oxidoreductase [Candidatus Hydrogenedentota bacterium]|nr:MAG: SDR family oxidoreductase [Candidatus Hydrogenedentota bacterium]
MNWAVITGASGAIGRAISACLAQRGFSLVLHYHSAEEPMQKFSFEISRRYNVDTKILPADFTSENSTRAFCETLESLKVPLQCLIHCAGGVPSPNSLSRITPSDWNTIFSLNATAPFFITQAALRLFVPNSDIIFISSISTKYGGGENTLHYAAAKAAVESIARGLARRLAAETIKVNVIRAGFILTGAHKKMGRTREDIQERISKIPLRRVGTPDDISRAVSFLLDSPFVTGSVVEVTGGD